MRPSDYACAAACTGGVPLGLLVWEGFSPSYVYGSGGFAPIMRLGGWIGLGAGFIFAYQRSSCTSSLIYIGHSSFSTNTTCTVRFLGLAENSREVDKDMREMVDKVKRGESLYGASQLSTDHQSMAARNSKHNVFFTNILPWPNLVAHPHHGVDTAKYYQQAERELEADRVGREGS
jgi:hypothetical protein